MQQMYLIDDQKALAALDGNQELLLELANMFCEDVPGLMQELHQALDDKDAIRTRAALHSLKGLVATFYAQPAVELAQRLEDEASKGSFEMLGESELAKLKQTIQSVQQEFYDRGWLSNGNSSERN